MVSRLLFWLTVQLLIIISFATARPLIFHIIFSEQNVEVIVLCFQLALALFAVLKKKIFNQADVPPSYEECATGRGPNNIKAGYSIVYNARRMPDHN